MAQDGDDSLTEFDDLSDSDVLERCRAARQLGAEWWSEEDKLPLFLAVMFWSDGTSPDGRLGERLRRADT